MIASSPSGATVRSQSAEITPAAALPPSLPLPGTGSVCVQDWPGGETKVAAVLSRWPSNFSSKLAKQMENINQNVARLTTGTSNSLQKSDCSTKRAVTRRCRLNEMKKTVEKWRKYKIEGITCSQTVIPSLNAAITPPSSVCG